MAGNIGEAIGLQFQQPRDTSGRLIELLQYQEEKKAKAEKAKKDLITMKDFVVNDKDLLPAYAKEIAEERAKAINLQAAAVQANDMNAVYMIDAATRQRVAEIRTKNAAAVQYINQDPTKFEVNYDIVRALRDPNSTVSSLEKLGAVNGNWLGFGTQGTIYYTPIIKPNVDPYFKSYETKKTINYSKTRPVPGTTQIQYETSVAPTQESIDQNARALTTDVHFQIWALATRPELKGKELSDPGVNDELFNIAREIGVQRAPATVYSYELLTKEKAPSGDKDKLKTLSLEFDKPAPGFSESSITPISANVADAKLISVYTDKALNEETGKVYSKEGQQGKPSYFNLKPGTLIVLQQKGQWKIFVRGNIYETIEVDSEGKEISTREQKAISVLVPIDVAGVESSLANTYDLRSLYDKINQLNTTGKIDGREYKAANRRTFTQDQSTAPVQQNPPKPPTVTKGNPLKTR